MTRWQKLLYEQMGSFILNNMKAEAIYVEMPIRTTMAELWEHTQNPVLHQQWDLRFTTIGYLPKVTADEPQRFLYTTQIGFGWSVSGAGESVGQRDGRDGRTTSALKFWSDEPISLIQSGSGYWQYVPNGQTIRFLTWYNYQTRFGLAGRLFDKIVFRPLIGWATAWSFDALRLWLERGISPAISRRHTAVHVIIQLVLAAIWIYQGVVPKLLFPHTGELDLLQASGLFPGWEASAVILVGLAEFVIGCLFLIFHAEKRLHYLNIAVLLLLGLGAWLTQSELFISPFNPVSLTLAMIALSLISILNNHDLPTARNCLRRPPEK